MDTLTHSHEAMRVDLEPLQRMGDGASRQDEQNPGVTLEAKVWIWRVEVEAGARQPRLALCSWRFAHAARLAQAGTFLNQALSLDVGQ